MELKKKIDSLVISDKVEWKKHALQRIFERSISKEVRYVISSQHMSQIQSILRQI